jgi:hypothetical protein
MADYYTVLQRAVAALPENTGAGRRAIYDKARAALVRQLETIQPPLPAAEIAKQRLSLEEAVRRIEADVARSVPPRTTTPPAPAEPRREPPPPRPPVARTEAPRPEPARAEPPKPEPARAEPPRTEPPRSEPAVRAEAPRPETPEPARAAPVRPPVPPRAEPPAAEVEPPAPRRGEPVRPAPRVDLPARGETPPTAKAAPPLDIMRRDEAADDDAPRAEAPRIAVRRGGEATGGAAPRLDAPRLDAARPVPPLPAAPLPTDAPLGDDGDESDDSRARRREERQARKEERRLARLGRSEDPASDDGEAEDDGAPRKDAERDVLDDANWPAPAAETPPLRLPKKRRRNYGPLIAALVVLVIVAGGAALAYVYRDVLLAQVEALVAEEPPAQRRTATPAQQNGEPVVAKDEDRLPSANGQNGTPPAAGTAPGTPADTRAVNTTRIVTPQTTPTSDPAAPATGDTASGTPPADGSAPPADAPETAPTPEAAGMTGPSRGILYEEGETAGAKGAALNGDVKWEMVRESIGGAAPEPIVRATIAVPERQATTTIIFRRNRDDALPASHLIEVAFELPPEFPGGGISNLPGLIMKVTENARGDALIGASARVSDGLFWIALSASETDVTHNLELLKDRGWIDLPMLYDNGRRAILTVEKGSAGAAAIDEAITAWAAEPAN